MFVHFLHICVSVKQYDGAPFVRLVNDDIVFIFKPVLIPSLGRLGLPVVGLIWEMVSVILSMRSSRGL